MILQRTIEKSITISGIGLHSGARINLKLRPAEANTGIVFYRTDGEQTIAIKASHENVVDTRMATVIGSQGATVSTIEHFMAALSAFGIDNLNVDIDGPEVPVLDGSAAPFIREIQQAGIKALPQSRKFIAIRKPLEIIEGEKRISIIPSRFFRITFDIAFDHKAISVQQYSMKFTTENFCKDIASARTFGFLQEVEYLKANGLARGGSLENAVVIDNDGVMNPEGLRYPDEFVRHKILDACGDFSLIGHPILGHIRAFKAGHDLNAKMVQTILEHPSHWTYVEFSEQAVREARRANAGAFAIDLAWSKA
ncbi:UDP-3-O-[3-hydroxymyristoyl] N-acetylglucosamine deacetylase [Malonomonas rubra DSM 5091]|uniref:UDP-3-O-acyl-N-acetylglucosamine deacetylase n=1 Tax=Malonomonas rubra DSM 5091 TaxID=1122189 RepID=A0A1M6M3Y8_MALRU|nr:UDP-3-O-acyl-N-acetylglucosamine deacetylase [Malonomonas rubra]SHJ78189.1 UDP-3-O-[3-hydroxymyristoyl] N-acetylglucosamine deacetylase [Malonomonas rubra DSM 5091]